MQRSKKLFFIGLAMVLAAGAWIFHNREGYVATYHMLGPLGALAFVSTLVLLFVGVRPWLDKLIDHLK